MLRLLIPALMPKLVQWIEGLEAEALAKGVALNTDGVEIARAVGVKNPERIRFLKVEAIPLPSDHMLRLAFRITNLIGPQTGGMSCRYGILLTGSNWEDAQTQAHEMVHTAQYERLGIARFLQLYAEECLTIGYPFGPLEQEARNRSADLA